MTYNPISPNVIRQALRWMGAPKPIRMITGKTPIISAGGTIMNSFVLHFDLDKLRNWLDAFEESEELPRPDTVRSYLQECFCDDVIVEDIFDASYAGVIHVYLLCVVPAHD